jgi:hypothetical protein
VHPAWPSTIIPTSAELESDLDKVGEGDDENETWPIAAVKHVWP